MDKTRGNLGVRSGEVFSRRTVAGGLAIGGLVAAFLATAGRRDALAEATPTAAPTGPNRYVLKGGDVEVIFVPAASTGTARLDYRDAKSSLTFTGDDLVVERSHALGQLVSVLIEYAADGFDRYLTLLVPEVNPDEDGGDVPIQTAAIVTTHWTSIGGPALVKGPLQTYAVVDLDGTAEFGTT
ncbi:MAG TPA: hypothetical protein VH482_15790 [Thermomicrobiales bacterium]|jgi:hypothetical protein